MKVSEKVSLGGEGVEGEADEGDAAGVRGGQGEQAKKQIYCSHLKSSLVFSGVNSLMVSNLPDILCITILFPSSLRTP